MWPPSKHAQQVLADWQLSQGPLAPIHMGHINETYTVQDGPRRFILQRLNPIFRPEIHQDIEVMTGYLAAAGLTTPHLIRTHAGTLWTHDVDQGVWRLQSYMPGRVYHQADSAARCYAAGLHLGRFHRILAPVKHTFMGARLGVHDTARHVTGLQQALITFRQHTAYARIAPLADQLLAAAEKLPAMGHLQQRIVHGDPKISNFVFTEEGDASCLIDLDTMGTMALPLELGDAFRSWCNPNGEGQGISVFQLDWFTAGLRGYAEGIDGLLSVDEIRLLPLAVQTISVELAVRFLRDALEERYFGWDSVRYTAAWEHNLVRAHSQWALAGAYACVQAQVYDIVANVFGRCV